MHPDYTAYDLLAVPTAVTRKDHFVYVNRAMARLLGVPPAEMIGQPVEAMAQRFIVGEDLLALQRRFAAADGALKEPLETWVQLQGFGANNRTVWVRLEAVGRSDLLFIVLEVPGMDEMRRLTLALSRGAEVLLRADDEAQVQGLAADLLAGHGLYCTFLTFQGDVLRSSAIRQPPEAVLTAETFLGRPVLELQYPVAALAHLPEMMRSRSARYHDDAFAYFRRLHPGDLMDQMERMLPPSPVMDVVMFVEDRPFGVLMVMGPELSPALAAPLELFAGLVGSAIEAVRYHRRANERLAELQRLQKELVQRERLAVIGEAAAVVSHEVRNPLGAIINAVSFLKRDRGLSGDSVRVVQMAEEEAHRLNALVQDLVEFSRPLDAQPCPTDLWALADGVLASLSSAPENRQVRIEMAAQPTLPPVEVDPNLVRMAITNLVKNAVQSSPPRGRVRVSVEPGDGEVVVVVDDEGAGVNPKDLPRLFTPFFTTRATGTGLGLAVVDRVAKLHSGRVEVGRSPSGGARFSLHFPTGPSRGRSE